ncbi:MAG TPA: flagellar hook protein FlgE [Alphaproteobacteria bacterium]
MSLYGALFAGVSGLNAQTQSMAMISDNIANLNTIGYKRVTARFATLVTNSGSLATHSPAGVRSTPFYTINQQGQISTTNSDTDVAISGNGFMVVNTETDGSGAARYTRAGSFTPDSLGNLRNSSGYYLQGWALDANGNLPAASADLSSLTTVNIGQFSGTASATSTVGIGTNLDAGQTIFGGAYAVNDMAAGTVTPHFFRNFVVFDSLGASHELTVAYLKTGINTWAVEVYAAVPAEVTAGATALASGNIVFNGDATLDADNAGTTIGTVDPITSALETPTSITWTNGASASTIDIDWGTNDLADGVSQFFSNYNVSFLNQNGASVGLLNGVSIDEDGFVVASFTNGQTRSAYKLPISTFADPTSLRTEEGNAYSETNRSGNFNLREAGLGGAGNFVPSALESSNVDIAREFTELIITQRAYSANTRVITTADEMLDELIRLRR